jgi:hypothetical protein
LQHAPGAIVQVPWRENSPDLDAAVGAALESSAGGGKIFHPVARLATANASIINRFCVGIAIALSLGADEKEHP